MRSDHLLKHLEKLGSMPVFDRGRRFSFKPWDEAICFFLLRPFLFLWISHDRSCLHKNDPAISFQGPRLMVPHGPDRCGREPVCMPERHGCDRSFASTADRPHDRDAIIGGAPRPRREPATFDRQALAGRSAGAAGVGFPRLFHACSVMDLQRERPGSLVRRGAGPFCRQAKGRRGLEHLRGHRRRPKGPPDYQEPGGLPKPVLPGHAVHARFSGALAPDYARE